MTRKKLLPLAIPFAAVAFAALGMIFVAEQTLEELREVAKRAHHNIEIFKDGELQAERCVDRGGAECDLVGEVLKPRLALLAAREEMLKPKPDRHRIEALLAPAGLSEPELARAQWVGAFGRSMGWWPEMTYSVKIQSDVPALLNLNSRAKEEHAKPYPDPAALESIRKDLRAEMAFRENLARQFDSQVTDAAYSARRMLYLIVAFTTLVLFAIAAWISNRILRALEAKERLLKERDESYRLAVEAADLGTWQWELPTGAVLASERCKALLGLAPDGDCNSSQFLDTIHPGDRVLVNDAVTAAIKNGTDYDLEYRVRGPDGCEHWVRAIGRIRKSGGNPQMHGVLQDVTARKKSESEIRQLNESLERRVRERTAQLQDVNRELEAFSYSVSHDLRAPLRSVEGFAKILLRDYGKTLDERASDLMQRMNAGAKRMGQLIEDLLMLSRINRSELNRQAVDLGEISTGVLADLASRDPARNVQVHIEPDMTADADPRLVRVALENLLGNAWKFTGKTECPEISVGAIRDGGETVFFVRDNGAGFDMAHVDQLFAPFQRLHRADEFDGTGVGLATVQRIIRRHGGRIWAESKPAQGAAFSFTLGTNGCNAD